MGFGLEIVFEAPQRGQVLRRSDGTAARRGSGAHGAAGAIMKDN